MEKELEILEFINKVIREEKGSRVTIDSMLRDTALDSFGYTVLFLELDDAYEIFADVPEGEDPFQKIEWDTLTIKEVIERCI